MKKQLFKRLSVATALCVSMSIPVNAANWSLVNNIWNYTDDSGALTKDGWRWIDSNYDGISKCYYFDANGSLIVNGTTPDAFTVNESGAWTKDGTIQYKEGAWASWPNEKGETKWYYQNADGSFVTNGWRLLDGNHDGISEYYYFDASGQMLETTLTPDGKTVNSDGKMLDENGNVLSVETPNTKSFGLKSTGNNALGTGLASGGSSGGGGGSSSGGGGGSSLRYSSYSGRTSTTSASGSANSSQFAQKMEGMRPVITTEEKNDNSTYYTIADYRYGSAMSDMVSDKEKAAVEKKIQLFMDKYITGSESDFLKVELICRYLTKNVSYDSDDDGSSTKYKTAYEALCKGKAQCMGYADAFLQMATALGLDARYVYSDIDARDRDLHVYNLVCVEGEWLIVDPTNAFSLSERTELSNDCVLLKESDLNEYGYIDSEWNPVMVCYGTPETRFAYDGPNMLRGNDIQTADGNPYISNYPEIKDYLDFLYCRYIDCEDNADEILCFTGKNDKDAAERIVDKLISYAGTTKKLAVLWDRINYDDAMQEALEILDAIHAEGYDIKIPYGSDYVLRLIDGRNLSTGYHEYDCYAHASIWQIEKLAETTEDVEETVEQPVENTRNDSNTEKVNESEDEENSDAGNTSDSSTEDLKNDSGSVKNADETTEDAVKTGESDDTENIEEELIGNNDNSSDPENTDDSESKTSDNANNESSTENDVPSSDSSGDKTSGNDSTDTNG